MTDRRYRSKAWWRGRRFHLLPVSPASRSRGLGQPHNDRTVPTAANAGLGYVELPPGGAGDRPDRGPEWQLLHRSAARRPPRCYQLRQCRNPARTVRRKRVYGRSPRLEAECRAFRNRTFPVPITGASVSRRQPQAPRRTPSGQVPASSPVVAPAGYAGSREGILAVSTARATADDVPTTRRPVIAGLARRTPARLTNDDSIRQTDEAAADQSGGHSAQAPRGLPTRLGAVAADHRAARVYSQ